MRKLINGVNREGKEKKEVKRKNKKANRVRKCADGGKQKKGRKEGSEKEEWES